jgi:tRNA nucleotidyltransferase (CCA-adding enzyme)
MVTYDIGRLPVLDQGQLVGIVTRTDVLRQVYHDSLNQHPPAAPQPDRHPLPSLYQRLQQQLTAAAATQPLWQILTRMAQEAQQRGWHLYLVGGAVRDLLLADADHPLPLKDIDLVVDSLYSHALVGAGVELAQVIQQQDPTVDLQVHGQFQTAALIWHTPTHLGPLVIDVATARTEFYPYPAANPEVEASSIRQDLYRRDFTINAMAIRLTPPQPGLLLDFFGGWLDLQQRQIRVLHANSFIEDPTRIYRAVRFAVRLGFDIDRQTEQFIRHAIDSGIYTVLQGQPGRAPALQTRLKAELKYILESLDWPIALSRLDQLGALSCLHPTLTLTPDLWHQLRRVDRWIQRFQLAQSLEPWQMLLEVLIASLAPAWRQQVAAILQLPASAMDRLTRLAAIETELLQTLSAQSRPSEIYQALKPYDLPTLLLVSTRHPRRLGPQAWQYWTRLSAMKPLLNGDDLKHLGYAPGPLFRTILTDLTNATLNGDIRTRQAAQKYVQQRYPR